MNKLLSKIFILLTCTIYLHADSMFLLTKMDKVYLVVENYSSKLPMSIKKEIYEGLNDTAKELKIDTTGYSYRTFGILLYDTSIGDQLTLNIDLIVGEEVKRIDDNEEVFALTYEKRKQFIIDNKDQEEIADQVSDYVDLLLVDFIKQYKEDNE